MEFPVLESPHGSFPIARVTSVIDGWRDRVGRLPLFAIWEVGKGGRLALPGPWASGCPPFPFLPARDRLLVYSSLADGDHHGRRIPLRRRERGRDRRCPRCPRSGPVGRR